MRRDERNADDPSRAPDHERGGGQTKARSRWPLPRLILLCGGLALAVGLSAMLWRDLTGGARVDTAAPPATVGGPFRLIDQNGRAVNEGVLQGHWTAIFFGYTFCPDVCPATLSALKVAKDRLGPVAKDLQVIFVTIDPERDTPVQLKRYLSTPAFPQPVIGLTGTPEQVAAIAKVYKVYYAKRGTGAGYLMDHASAIYLMDPKGRFHSLVSTAQGLDSMTADIAGAIGRS